MSDSYSKYSAALTCNNLLVVGAGGASPGISLMLLLLGFTIWLAYIHTAPIISSHACHQQCNSSNISCEIFILFFKEKDKECAWRGRGGGWTRQSRPRMMEYTHGTHKAIQIKILLPSAWPIKIYQRDNATANTSNADILCVKISRSEILKDRLQFREIPSRQLWQ